MFLLKLQSQHTLTNLHIGAILNIAEKKSLIVPSSNGREGQFILISISSNENETHNKYMATIYDVTEKSFFTLLVATVFDMEQFDIDHDLPSNMEEIMKVRYTKQSSYIVFR